MTGHNARRNYYNDDSSDIDARNERTSRNRGKRKQKKNVHNSPQSSIYSSTSSLVEKEEGESKKLGDEQKANKKCCSSPCHKKTILIGALIFLQISAFIGIGVFFGEQQREIDKHEHLLIYLHQQKFSCTKDIKKLADDMKHVVKDDGGEHAVVSKIIEDVKTIQKQNNEVQTILAQYDGDIASLKSEIWQVNSTVLELYQNYTQHIANKDESSSKDLGSKVVEEAQSKDITEIKTNVENMEETIKKLEKALSKEVGKLNSNFKGAAESINDLRTELLKEFESIADKTAETNLTLLKLQEDYEKEKVHVTSSLSDLKEAYDKSMEALKGESDDVSETFNDIRKKLKEDIQLIKDDFDAVNEEISLVKKELRKEIGNLKGNVTGLNTSLNNLREHHKNDVDSLKDAAGDVLLLLQDYKDDMIQLKTVSQGMNLTFLQFKEDYENDLNEIKLGTIKLNETMIQLKKKIRKEIKETFTEAKDAFSELGDEIPDLKMKLADVNETMFQLHGVYAKDILIVYNLSTEASNSINKFEEKQKKYINKIKKDFHKIKQTIDHFKENVTGENKLLKTAVTEVNETIDHIKENFTGDTALLKTAVTEALVTVLQMHENHTRDIEALNKSLSESVSHHHTKAESDPNQSDNSINENNIKEDLLQIMETKFEANVSKRIQSFTNSTKRVVKKLYKKLKDFTENVTALNQVVLDVNASLASLQGQTKDIFDNSENLKDIVVEMKKNFTMVIPYVNTTVTKVRKIVMKLKSYIGEIPELKIDIDQVNNTVFQLNDIYVKDILVIYNNSVKVSNILMQLRHEYMKDIADIRFESSKMNHSITRLRLNSTSEFQRSKRALNDLDQETKDSLSKLDNFTRTELTKLDQYTRSSVAELRLSDTGLFNSINDLKAVDSDVNNVIEDIKSNNKGFTDSINELKKRGFLHYPISDAIFVGFGVGLKESGGDATEGDSQKFDSITSCVMYCKSKKTANASFNGVRYDIYKRRCFCESNYLTHKDDQKYLHFWLAHDVD